MRSLPLLLILDTSVLSRDISGARVVAFELAKGWKKLGGNVWIITPYNSLDKHKEQLFSKVIQISPPVFTHYSFSTSFVSFVFMLRALSSLSKVLRKRSELCNSIIFSTSDFISDTAAAFVVKMFSSSATWLAFFYHVTPGPFTRTEKFSRFLKNMFAYVSQQITLILMKRADIILVESGFLSHYLSKYLGFKKTKILVASGGFYPEAHEPISTRNKCFDACFIGRIIDLKGVFDLIQAWKKVVEEFPNAKLAIIGGGGEEEINKLNNLILKADLEKNVYYFGFVSEKEKRKLLKASKLFILPSYEEGIPIVFYEAMYYALPVITYYLPTYNDVKNEIFSVKKGSIKDLAKAIMYFLRNDNLICEFGTKGKKLAEKHSWNEIITYIISCVIDFRRINNFNNKNSQ